MNKEWARLTPELLKALEGVSGAEVWVRVTQFNALHLKDGQEMEIDAYVVGVSAE